LDSFCAPFAWTDDPQFGHWKLMASDISLLLQ
jgi:hypothetical protein